MSIIEIIREIICRIDEQKINLTYETILPNFLNDAIATLRGELVEI